MEYFGDVLGERTKLSGAETVRDEVSALERRSEARRGQEVPFMGKDVTYATQTDPSSPSLRITQQGRNENI